MSWRNSHIRRVVYFLPIIIFIFLIRIFYALIETFEDIVEMVRYMRMNR